MSDIRDDLAYRGELNQRLKDAKMPFVYGLLWALRDGKEREVAERIRMTSQYDLFPSFFKLDLTESDIEKLYEIDTFSIQRHRLLLGIARFLEQDDVTPEEGAKVIPLLDLLAEKKFLFEERDVFLNGKLYLALRKIMPPTEALRKYEHFVSYDEKRYHNEAYNSLFERVISLAFRGANRESSEYDLRAIANCRHMIYIPDGAEVKRWINQLNSIGNVIESRAGQDNTALIQVGHSRAKHLMNWLKTGSSVEAMQPFMSTKTVASPKNAQEAFNKYVMTMTALSRINRAQPLSFDAQTPLTHHAFRLLARFIDKLKASDWEKLAAADDLPIDWRSILEKLPVERQEALVCRLPNLLPSVTNKAREHHFMGDLGL